MPSSPAQKIPEVGHAVQVRNRLATVRAVEPYDHPKGEGRWHIVEVEYLDDCRFPESEQLLWEVEATASVHGTTSLPHVDEKRPDSPTAIMAFVNAHRWTRLNRLRVPVMRGHAKTFVEGPVDYTDLRTEFIGLIYEGLLDYRLKRTDEKIGPQVFLNLGREPVLPLARLEDMLANDKKALKDLLTTLRKEKVTASADTEEEETEEKKSEEPEETRTSSWRRAGSTLSSAPADEPLSKTPYRLALLGLPYKVAQRG